MKAHTSETEATITPKRTLECLKPGGEAQVVQA
jgi:hypothetical protein